MSSQGSGSTAGCVLRAGVLTLVATLLVLAFSAAAARAAASSLTERAALASSAGAAGSGLAVRSDPSAPAADAAAGATRAAPVPDYLAQIRRNFTRENRVYARTRAALALLDPFYQIGIALLLLFSGLSARMRDLAHRLFRGRYGRMLVYFTLFNLIGFVLAFPLSWFGGFALEHRFALSNQSFAQWLGEQGKDLLVGTVLLAGTGIVALAYLAIEKSRKRWWLWIALGTLPVTLALTLLQPLVIDPLYNKFTPLRDQELRGKIVALATRAGIPGRNVYEVDRSRQTKKYNAYVNGFGVSQRIVLWDTTLRGMKQDEILFVMAHEMGHYRLAHIWKGIGLFFALSFALLFLSGLLMDRALSRFGPRWGLRELHDVASVPLFAGTLSLVLLVAQPALNAVSRGFEHEADTFGLEVTHSNDAAARAFIKLGSQNRSDPEPPAIVKLLEYSHPPLLERVRYALTYRPWEEGRPNRAFRPAR